MFPQEIQKRIESETFGINENAYGWRFREYLLPLPTLSEFKDHTGELYTVWVVLAEPDNGYAVIFDEDESEFGLAIGGVVIGTYGGFVDALNAM